MSTTQSEAREFAMSQYASKDDMIGAMRKRIADLESQLVKEAARSANEKRRADQMTEQHRMQAALNTEARAQLAERAAQESAIGAGGVSPLMGAAGDAGWVSVDERLPEPDWPVLAHNGKWTGVAAWMSGDYLEPLERWQDEHREFVEMMGPAITHWMPVPLPPTSSADSRKGE